jgi:hypothetical protein
VLGSLCGLIQSGGVNHVSTSASAPRVQTMTSGMHLGRVLWEVGRFVLSMLDIGVRKSMFFLPLDVSV